jgi:hypothetical protein
VHELPEYGMTAFTAALDNFLADDTPAYASARELGHATRHVAVFRTENYQLERVCSLAELRVAVALSSMVMAAYALEKTRAAASGIGMTADSTIVLALPGGGELTDLLTLQHAIAQGDSPRLIEGALDVWLAGEPPSHRYGSHYGHLWPRGTTKLTGYQAGVEGLVRLNGFCWTEHMPWFNPFEHGISSVLPRTKEALKHMREKLGIPVSHEKTILAIIGQLQETSLLVYLADSEN